MEVVFPLYIVSSLTEIPSTQCTGSQMLHAQKMVQTSAWNRKQNKNAQHPGTEQMKGQEHIKSCKETIAHQHYWGILLKVHMVAI